MGLLLRNCSQIWNLLGPIKIKIKTTSKRDRNEIEIKTKAKLSQMKTKSDRDNFVRSGPSYPLSLSLCILNLHRSWVITMVYTIPEGAGGEIASEKSMT